MWITTGDGLNRYDGEEFIVYKHSIADSNSIDWNKLFFVTEDKHGKIWVAPDHRRANIFDPETGKFREFDPEKEHFEPKEDAQTIPKPFAFAIPELIKYNKDYPRANKEAKTWIARHAGGMGEGNGDDDLILANYDGQRHYWRLCNVGTGLGYCLFNIDSVEWSHFTVQEKLDNNEQFFWYPVHSSPSLHNILDSVDVDFQKVTRVRVDNHKNLWFLSNEENELSMLDVKTKEIKQFGTNKDINFSVYRDDESSIWLTGKSGLTKIDTVKSLFKSIDLEFQSINIIQLNDGYLYANSEDYLIRIHPKTLETKPLYFNGLIDQNGNPENPRIVNISTIDGDYIWSSHLNWAVGLTRFDPVTSDYISYFKINYPTKNIIWPNKKEIWVDMYDGNEYNYDGKGTHIFSMDSLSYSQPAGFENLYYEYALLDASQNCIWACQNHHLLKVDLVSHQVDTFSILKNELSEIHHLYLDDTSLWMATDIGLIEVNTTNTEVLNKVTTTEGLPSNNVRSIIRSNEVLCLGTQNGLSLYHLKTKRIRNYYEEDGLTHNEFLAGSIFKDKDGMIWIGALDRIIAFSPNQLLAEEEVKSDLVFTRQSVFNTKKDKFLEDIHFSKDSIKALELKPTDQSFTQRFAILSYKNSDKNQYSWYLEGYESPWRNRGFAPIASYQNLPPGHYTLKVKAFDYRGTPANNTLSMSIDVLKVWYKRWWAYVIYALILGFAILLFNRFQLKRKLEQQEGERLKEMDALKTKLYTNITHEFRTPLTVMLGLARQIPDHLSSSTAADKIKTAASLIERNGNSLLQLVNQLLDLSKLESGNMVLDLIQGDITVYINYLVESFHSLAETKDIRLHHLPQVEELVMDYSPIRLEQIISNLLSNAIKFTPEGGDVYLSLAIQESGAITQGHRKSKVFKPSKNQSNTSFLVIQVKDTGIGIPAEKVSSIFDRFYQVDDTHTRQGEGTGIGLALVKELVNLMDGEITVDSSPDKGSTFSIFLPIKKEASTVTAKPDMSSKPALAISLKQSPLLNQSIEESTILSDGELPVLLIVEDNEDVAHYIRTCLENQYQILYAKNGQLGIDKAIENIPDLIISDVMMPEKSGYDLVQILKHDEITSHIPIVLLTAKADIESKLEGLEYGADAYLAKPFNEKELKIRLEKLLELRKRLQAKYSTSASLQTDSPNTAASALPTPIEDAFLLKVRTIVEENMDDPDFATPHLCRSIGLSKTQLYRKLKALTDQSIALHIRSIRLRKAQGLLESTDLTVSEIAYEVGFSDPAYFSRTYSSEFGFAPNETRKR